MVEKDEALFCAGACQQWLHRYCASISVKCYTDIKKSNSPFFSFCYSKDQDKHEILRLKEHVEHLKRELAELKESLPMAQSGVRGFPSGSSSSLLLCQRDQTDTSLTTLKLILSVYVITCLKQILVTVFIVVKSKLYGRISNMLF